MNFYWAYIFIPVIIYFISPKKDNKFLFLYCFLISVLSYDNVSDYYTYYVLFTKYINGFESSSYEKQLEIAWNFVFMIFSFTKYGNILIHSLVMAITTLTFYKYSKEHNLQNHAIILYFLLALVVLHDNIMRQDIAICLAYPAFFLALSESLTLKEKIPKIFLYTLMAFLFHYSAIFLLPFYYIITYF